MIYLSESGQVRWGLRHDADQGHELDIRYSITPATSIEALFVELNRAGYSGGVSIEWEDNDVEQHAGAKNALRFVHQADQPPSAMRHDEQLRA